MGKFKKGDRIVYICKNPDSHDRLFKLYAGMTGTVIKDGFDTGCTGIAFDNYTFGNGKYHNEVHVNDTDITFYTPKIKAGDIVELLHAPVDNASADYALIPGKTGVVINSKSNYEYRVVVSYDDFKDGWGKDKDRWFTNANLLKKLEKPKFKFDIGDVVKVSCSFSNCDNLIGKIINVSKSSFGRIIYLVEFTEGNITFFHDGNISGNKLIKGSRTGKDKHCYYLHDTELVKCDEKPKFKFDIGDRVIVYDCLLDHHNREGKIVNVCETSEGKLLYLVELDFAEPYRLHNGYNTNLKILAGAEKGKENQCYYAREDALCLLCKAGEKEVMFAM